MYMHYHSVQELRNATLPLENMLYFLHLHEARKGPRLPMIWEKALRAGLTRKLNTFMFVIYVSRLS